MKLNYLLHVFFAVTKLIWIIWGRCKLWYILFYPYAMQLQGNLLISQLPYFRVRVPRSSQLIVIVSTNLLATCSQASLFFNLLPEAPLNFPLVMGFISDDLCTKALKASYRHCGRRFLGGLELCELDEDGSASASGFFLYWRLKVTFFPILGWCSMLGRSLWLLACEKLSLAAQKLNGCISATGCGFSARLALEPPATPSNSVLLRFCKYEMWNQFITNSALRIRRSFHCCFWAMLSLAPASFQITWQTQRQRPCCYILLK